MKTWQSSPKNAHSRRSVSTVMPRFSATIWLMRCGGRPVDFASRYSRRTHVIDSRHLSMPAVPEEARAELSVLSMISASRRVLDHIAAHRGHDTSARRYMYKVAY